MPCGNPVYLQATTEPKLGLLIFWYCVTICDPLYSGYIHYEVEVNPKALV